MHAFFNFVSYSTSWLLAQCLTWLNVILSFGSVFSSAAHGRCVSIHFHFMFASNAPSEGDKNKTQHLKQWSRCVSTETFFFNGMPMAENGIHHILMQLHSTASWMISIHDSLVCRIIAIVIQWTTCRNLKTDKEMNQRTHFCILSHFVSMSVSVPLEIETAANWMGYSEREIKF